MNCKLIVSGLLCAASLLGCSSAPKLTLPTGDWVEVNQPGATPTAKVSSVPSPSAPKALSAVSYPTPRAPVVFGATPKPIDPTPAPISAPVATTPPATGESSPKTLIPATGALASTASKPMVTPTVVPPKVLAAPLKQPAVVEASQKPKPNLVVRPVPVPVETWVVSPADATLRHVLAKWAARAGWQLVWEASVDVPVTVSATFEGDFRSAVKRLFSSLSAADVNLSGLMYAGNRVLRVTESGRRAQ